MVATILMSLFTQFGSKVTCIFFAFQRRKSLVATHPLGPFVSTANGSSDDYPNGYAACGNFQKRAKSASKLTGVLGFVSSLFAVIAIDEEHIKYHDNNIPALFFTLSLR